LKKDKVYPATADLDYDHHIIGFQHNPDFPWCGFNFILSNGKRTQFPLKIDGACLQSSWREDTIDTNIQLGKVVIYGDSGDSEISSIEFFDTNNNLVLKAGKIGGIAKKEIPLHKGERIVGMQGNDYFGKTQIRDLIFIIGSQSD